MVIVVDDALTETALRLLFARVGARNSEFPALRSLGEFLQRYLSAVANIDGREITSLGEETALSFSHAVHVEVLRNRGLQPFLFHDAYQDAIMRAGGVAHARFPVAMLNEVVPASWIAIIAALIADGPDVAAARAQIAIYDYSLEEVKSNRRRVSGRRSRATVQLVVGEAVQLLQTAYSCRTLPACRKWTHVPKLHMPEMPKGGYEVLAPRVETIRQAWQDLTAEIHDRLGVGAIEEEQAALDSLSDNALLARGLWRATRDRVLLVLMVLTGGRRNALARLCRKDYITDCEGPLPDCRRGAALDLRPRKGKGREEVRRKPILDRLRL